MQTEINNIKEDIRKIKENHLTHIQDDISEIKISMKGFSTNQDWLMRFFWIIATTSIGGLITGIFNLIIK